MTNPLNILLFSLLLNFAPVHADTVFTSFDGFKLPMSVELPDGMSAKDVKTVCVIVHGSGPINMDGDLSAESSPDQIPNLVYKDIAAGLRSKGIATIRYNKRFYEIRQMAAANKDYVYSASFKKMMEHPLNNLIDDVSAVAEYARKEFPGAKVLLLGHSEGTHVALIAASRAQNISGVALIGFYNEPIRSMIFEQTVYRPLSYFHQLDVNSDEILSPEEMNANTPVAQTVKRQLPMLDIDKDGALSLSEFMAASYSNLVAAPEASGSREYTLDEAALPRSSEIIGKSKFKILFLQGEWDNQTPSYLTKSIQIANQTFWKKDNLRFVYFPKAGHALDPRNRYNDNTFRRIPKDTLNKLASEISGFLASETAGK